MHFALSASVLMRKKYFSISKFRPVSSPNFTLYLVSRNDGHKLQNACTSTPISQSLTFETVLAVVGSHGDEYVRARRDPRPYNSMYGMTTYGRAHMPRSPVNLSPISQAFYPHTLPICLLDLKIAKSLKALIHYS